MEDTIQKIEEFEYYKRLIKSGEAGKRNTIIERKDGSHAIIHQTIDFRPIPGLSTNLDEIERITVFIGDKEFEFVACQ
jgi:hypothetical protein